MKNYARFQDKIDVSRAISIIKDLTCLVENSFKASMKNDMLDFNVIKCFGINTRNGKVLCHLPVRWKSPFSEWVKTDTDGVAKRYLVLLWKYEIVYWGFSAFLNVQTALVAEFYGVIYDLDEVQKMEFTNVWLECDSTLV